MKKKVLSLLFACILVISVLVLAGCKTDDLEVQMNENATKAEADLKAEADALQKKLDEAKTALEAAIEKKADKTALEAAVADFNTAVEAAKTFATTADTNLKTTLEAAIAAAKKEVADSVTALAAKVDAKADKTAVAELQSALNTLKGVTATDDELAAAIADAEKKAYEAFAKTWNDTTEEVIEYLYNLEVAYYEIYGAAADAGLGEVVFDNLFKVYNESKVRLSRALDEDSAKEMYEYAEGKFEAVAFVIDAAEDYMADAENNYYEDEIDELEDLLNDALDAVIDVEYGNTADFEEIETELAEDLANVATIAEVDYATDINNRVDALIAALALDNGYNAVNVAEYTDILADIDAWKTTFGDDVNKDLIDTADVDEMKEDYDDVKAEYDEYVEDLTARVDEFVTDYTYDYNDDLNTINALYVEAVLWVENVSVRGFELTEAQEDLLVAFEEGAYARANALEIAITEADAIDELVAELYEIINVDSLRFKKAYMDAYKEIVELYNDWVDTYFADYEEEMVEGNVNWNMVDHAAYKTLKDTYDAKFGAITEAVNAVNAAYADPNFVTITTNSAEALAKAETAVQALTNLLTNLDLEIENDLGLPSNLRDTLAAKQVKYDELIAERNALYNAAKDALNKTYADLVLNTDGIYTAQGLKAYEKALEDHKAAIAAFNADKNSGVEGFVGATAVDGIFATADLEIAKANALVDVSEAYVKAVYTDNAAGDVADALKAAKTLAETNVLADTATVDSIEAEVAEALADIAEIQVAAKAYNDAIADIDTVVAHDDANGTVKAGILAAADASLNKALDRIAAVDAEAIELDETYALANAELKVNAREIAEYVENSVRVNNVAYMVKAYNIYVGSHTPMTSANDLDAALEYVSNYFDTIVAPVAA